MVRSRFHREPIRITQAWFEADCRGRLTERDREILRFVWTYQIVTGHQVARGFYQHSKQPVIRADTRLRSLYDLHCLDRFFPIVAQGTAPQHLVLDVAGARALDIHGFRKIQGLTATYRHSVAVADVAVASYRKGMGWGDPRAAVGPVRPDLWYPSYRLAIEVDLATEDLGVIRQKWSRYQEVEDRIDWLLFLTTCPQRTEIAALDRRVDRVISLFPSGSRISLLAGRLTAEKLDHAIRHIRDGQLLRHT